MTDRWRRDDDRARSSAAEDRRQQRASGGAPNSNSPTPGHRDDWNHEPDGGLDSGRGFGRVGVSRTDPWAGERGHHDTAARGPWTAGRREDYAGRGPKNYRRSDERILEEVSDRLTDDAMVDASEIAVDVKQGEVVLSGTVKDRGQKRRAEDLAERVSGVKDVINGLRISASAKPGSS